MPDWYPFVDAARELGQHPAEMAGIPETKSAWIWVMWTLDAKAAEHHVRNEHARKQNARG